MTWIADRMSCYLQIVFLSTLLFSPHVSAAFDVNQSEVVIKQIELNLKQNKYNIEEINQAIDTVSRLEASADECISKHSKAYKQLNQLIQKANLGDEVTFKDKAYLTLKKKEEVYLKSITQCMLSVHKIQGLKTKLLRIMYQERTEMLFIKDPPIQEQWQDFNLSQLSLDFWHQEDALFLKTCILVGTGLLFLMLSCFVFSRIQLKEKLFKGVASGFKLIILACVATVIALGGLGYDAFLAFFIRNIILSSLILFVVWQMIVFILKYTRLLLDVHSVFAKKTYALLGLPVGKRLTEVSILRYLLPSALMLRLTVALFKLWDPSKMYLQAYMGFFEGSYSLFGIDLSIAHVFRVLVAFCVVLLIGRIVAGVVSTRRLAFEEKYILITVVALIRYGFFILAIIISLIILGVNFSRFELVAGALSVGIGFGLKGIATDFFCGIILFVKRTVKPGDRVLIQEEEGLVQKVGLLSTTLRTAEKSDVIVPNSSLVNETIKNYTYQGKSLRLVCKIELMKATDLKKAEKALFDTAMKLPSIVSTGHNQPRVVLDLDVGMFLTLLCVIHDVHTKENVLNELNHEVLKTFKARKIQLKFQDVS